MIRPRFLDSESRRDLVELARDSLPLRRRGVLPRTAWAAAPTRWYCWTMG